MRFEVLTAASLKMVVFWVVAPSTSEMSENFYQTTRRNNPEDSQRDGCFILWIPYLICQNIFNLYYRVYIAFM
jgi:hypothetical protein